MNKVICFTSLLCLCFTQQLAAQQDKPITFRLGEIQVSTLPDGDRQGKSQMLSGTTPELIKEYTPDGTYPMGMNAFLLRTPTSTILIDTGNGIGIRNNLDSLGVAPEKVNAVLLTHAHGDHVGGLLSNGKCVFPNADIYISKREYDYWTTDERRAFMRDIFSKYKDKLHIFSPDTLGKPAKELLPGIHAYAAYGHTPGHCMYMVESKDSKMLFCGDVIYALALELANPSVSLPIESDPTQGITTRREMLEYVADNHIRIAGAHIPYPGIGDVTKQREDGTYKFTPVCTCEGW